MVKTTFIALTLTLTTVFCSFLTSPAIAAESEELAIVTADRDNLRARLSRAIAYSKVRGEKLEETEMQLLKSMSERKELADRLRRVIAISKERRINLTNSNASRKQTEDRLRRAIAVSKERRINLTNANASRKQAEDRLRRAIAVSKERGINLTNANTSRKRAEDRLQRVIAVSKSMRDNLQEQLENSKESKSTAWVAQAGASLRTSVRGLEGAEIIENYDDKSVKVQLGNNGLFRRAGSTLSKSGKALLSKIAPQLISQDASITVIGHTDSIPVGQGGLYENNEALSLARSLSALQYLRSQGIPKEQLSAAGHGADSPIASNDTQEGRQQNRRVEIVLQPN